MTEVGCLQMPLLLNNDRLNPASVMCEQPASIVKTKVQEKIKGNDEKITNDQETTDRFYICCTG